MEDVDLGGTRDESGSKEQVLGVVDVRHEKTAICFIATIACSRWSLKRME